MGGGGQDPLGWPVHMSRGGQQGRGLWSHTSTADEDAWDQGGPLSSLPRLSYRKRLRLRRWPGPRHPRPAWPPETAASRLRPPAATRAPPASAASSAASAPAAYSTLTAEAAYSLRAQLPGWGPGRGFRVRGASRLGEGGSLVGGTSRVGVACGGGWGGAFRGQVCGET